MPKKKKPRPCNSWKETWQRFVTTGEPESFMEHLNSCELCSKATDYEFDQKAKIFKEIGRLLTEAPNLKYPMAVICPHCQTGLMLRMKDAGALRCCSSCKGNFLCPQFPRISLWTRIKRFFSRYGSTNR
jgi:hypothetical protein